MSDIESICKPMSDMSLGRKLDAVKKTLKQINQPKFKDEAELSKKLISKLPCIKSCNKVTTLKDFESIHEEEKEPKRPESLDLRRERGPFYVKVPNPPA